MRTRRDILTPTIVIAGIVLVILFLWAVIANAQTHTMPGSNVVPSGASLTINSGGSITAAAGSTVTGFGSGGGGNVSNVGTPTVGQKATWTDATHIQGVTDNALQWDGGSTSLVAATGRTSLGLVVGTNVEAWDTDLDVWATKTPYAGNVTITTGKTFTDTNNLTLSGTDGSTLNIGGGGTLGTAAYTASGAYEVPLTFSQSLTRATNTVTLSGDSASPGNSMLYGTNGSGTKGWYAQPGGGAVTSVFTRTGAVVAASGDYSAFYQPLDTDLTTWAGITPATGVGTYLAAPNSANLRSMVTDENGTGALLFSGATTPDFTTGFTIGAAAASGKIPIGDDTKYGPSTPTWPTVAGTAGKHVESDGTNLIMSTPTYPTAAGTAGYTMRSDGTNFATYPQDILNSSVASQSPSTSDVYLTGSNIVVAAGDFKAKGQYRCLFDVTKSAGTGAIVISVRIGTAGTTSDTAQLTFTFGVGTSVADTGTFEIIVTWRTVGSGTSAVVQGICRSQHNVPSGMFSNAAAWTIVATTSSGFASNTATNIGLSFNGGTAFAGTTTLVQASLLQ